MADRTTATVPIDRVECGTRLRGISEEQVAALMTSIAEVGLLNPITVYRRQVIEGGIAVPGFGLVAGLHRLEACRRLGMTEVPAHLVDMPDLKRQLAECDENLCGTKLTPSERTLFTRRRKHIYLALHPETRHGQNQHTRSRKVCDSTPGEPADRFTADTSAKTGRSERAIQLDATRGERVAEEILEEIRGTDLDKGTVLDALASVPKDAQPEEVRRLRTERGAGEPRRGGREGGRLLRDRSIEDVRGWLAARLDATEMHDLGEMLRRIRDPRDLLALADALAREAAA